jgi:hypothetical protein
MWAMNATGQTGRAVERRVWEEKTRMLAVTERGYTIHVEGGGGADVHGKERWES